jgi:hypothetical protein
MKNKMDIKQVKRQIGEVIVVFDGYEFQMTLPSEWHNEQFTEWKSTYKHAYKTAKAEMKIEHANLPVDEDVID